MTIKRVLIEDWLPVQELGIESRRERAVSTTLPPLSRLHVWWARRPLAASAGVMLSGLLPQWTSDLASKFPNNPEISSELKYKQWLLRLVGIWGDPIEARRLKDNAEAAGVRLQSNPFTYKMAYKNSPDSSDILLLQDILVDFWGELPCVLDPTAGGGSIPFTAIRFGLPTHANDLNGIAAAVLTAGIKIPAERGLSILEKLRHWGKIITNNVETELAQYFPQDKSESITNYIWVNAITCPRTGLYIPLMPDKWIRKEKSKEISVSITYEKLSSKSSKFPIFTLNFGNNVNVADADKGTVKRGEGVSPFDNLVIDGDHIKAEAQSGKMIQLLYAVAIRKPSGERTFRDVSSEDLTGIKNATNYLQKVRSEWEDLGYIPTEIIPTGLKTLEPIRYGINMWTEMFTDRQLLVHATFAKVFAEMMPEIRAKEGEMSDDILLELALMQGKALNYNSRLTSWNAPRQVTRSVFDRHDFAFKWTFAEMEGARELYPWTMHVIDNYHQIVELLEIPDMPSEEKRREIQRKVTVTQGSASNLISVNDKTIAHLCMDPPYFDNVMYAELSDFFYVWEKRTLGRLRPDFFPGELSDKEDEAVANSSRFESAGRRKNELAEMDYQAKMTAIFAECKRVLRDDGVMSVMFTHKKAEAWDSLGTGLLNAGFTIETSWPVNTEAEKSLHQANMNSAASTIMLVCRKKRERSDSTKVFLEDIAIEVRTAAREAVTRFEKDGINGVDLLLSTYGPTLSVISKYWPVYSSTPDETGKDRLLRPEEALDLARQELVGLRQRRLVGHSAQLDELTDFVVIAWDTFKAREFAFDTARLLALAVGGLDIETLVTQKVVSKSAGKVTLLRPSERIRKDSSQDSAGVRIDQVSFNYMIDAIDTALYIALEDGMAGAKRFLERSNLLTSEMFKNAVQAMVNAIPRTTVNGSWVIEEAGLLDVLVTSYLPDIILPPKEELKPQLDTPTLFDVT